MAEDLGLSEAALQRLVGFGRYLRSGGLRVGPGRVLTFCRAAAALDPFDRRDLHAAARAALVSRPEDFPALDAAFARYFSGQPVVEGGGSEPGRDGDAGARASADAVRGDAPSERTVVRAARWSSAGLEEEAEEEAAIRIVASAAEVLRKKDFGELSESERRAASTLIRRLAFSIPVRRSRRYRAALGRGRFDIRRTIRQSLRTEGEPFRRAWKARGSRQRPLVLILDVSGSMAPYSRPLVEFAHAAVTAGRKVEVFVFGTHLTRITRSLRARDPRAALAMVGAAVTDWEGGTRIGDSLKELLDEWSSRSALRGSIVVLCSDGLERGDPEALAVQMRRLARLAHRLVWVNPLKGSPRYEPLARGMAASLPHVDVFLPGHNLESLEALGKTVAVS
jgi:uncharacterized protein with von Willebrand factor type A (vWA) domain